MIHLAAALLAVAPALALDKDKDFDAAWVEDYDQAVALARESKRDMLVMFTGSDWCGWCIALHEESLDDDKFVGKAKREYVLVSLDFPKDPAVKLRVPSPVRNQELASLYGVEGYPTVLLVSADGLVLGRTGYKAGGSKAYLDHLDELRKDGKKLASESASLAKKFEKAKGSRRDDAWRDMVNHLKGLGRYSAYAAPVAEQIASALEWDSTNERGRKAEAVEVLVEAGQVDAAVMEAAAELDPQGASGLHEAALAVLCTRASSGSEVEAALAAFERWNALGVQQDPERAFHLCVRAARWLVERPEGAAKAAQCAARARSMAPDGTGDKRLDAWLAELAAKAS